MNSANFNACYCGRVADLLGLPLYPPPYLYTAGENISYGVNFAVGGSGVFKVLSNVSLDVQVDNFELFLRTDPYSKAALENSVTYVSVGGNDYLAFRGTTEAVSLKPNVSNHPIIVFKSCLSLIRLRRLFTMVRILLYNRKGYCT